MKKKLLGLVLVLTLSLVTFATLRDDDNLDNIRKDVGIVINVLNAALESPEGAGRGRHFGISSVEGHYLKGQGVLLQIEPDGMGFPGHFKMALPIPPVPPIGPVISPGFRFRGDDEDEESANEHEQVLEEMSEHLDEVMEEAQEGVASALEGISEMNDLLDKKTLEEVRALREKLNEGKLRDLRKQIRDKRKLIHTAKSAPDRDKLLQEFENLKKDMQAEVSKYQVEADRIIKIQAARRDERIKEFEGKVLDALCNYGSGMRSLPANEYVTVILKRVESDEDGKGQDRVYVFKKSDLLDCRDGKLTRDQMLAKSGAYRF